MEIFLCSKVFRHCTVTGAQGGFQHVAREVPGHNSLAHSPQQNEAQPTVQNLLVDCHVLEKVLRLHLRGGHDRKRSEEHTSELQSLMRISYAVFCLKKKNTI